MSRFRCYITPFLETGEYGEAVEVTNDIDMDSMGQISQQIDNDQYAVGVLTYNDLTLKLRNESGRYSPPEIPESMFRFKRSDAIFQVYWEVENEGCLCGHAIAGITSFNVSKLVYEGFINDESTKINVKSHFITLRVLGLESVVSKIEVPIDDISNGDLTSEVIYALLNQSRITDLVSVLEANISVGVDTEIDDKASLESKTGKEALDDLLLISNSILYIKDRVLYVSSRDPGDDLAYTFYGLMSAEGLENIQDLSDINSGFSQMFNFWTWEDETFNVVDATSVARYGIRKEEISSELITEVSKKQAILEGLVNDYGLPKENFTLVTPVNYDTLELFYLDKVSVDYPTVYVPIEGREPPIYDLSKYDEAFYPSPESAVVIDAARRFKIMGVDISMKEQLVKFNLREI